VIHFVVVSGDPAAVERVAPGLRDALRRTRVHEGDELECVGTSGTWAMAAITAADPTGATRFASAGDAMVVVNGTALATNGDQRRLAEDALAAFAARGSDGAAAALGGSYNFVGVAPGVGLRAFADFSGLFPLYWAEGPDVAVFSNRSTTVADVLGTPGWNGRALAWVIGHANLFGDVMPARGASYLPPGREARVAWAARHVEIDRSPNWIWPGPADAGARDNLTDEEWHDVTNALVANFRALRTFDTALQLSITGGKDSRLCLALAKAAGLDDRIVTFTTGGRGNPEVECAAEVARVAGFAHETPGAPAAPAVRAGAPEPERREPRVPAPFNAEPVWQRLRQDVYRYEAILCPWSGMVEPLRRTMLNIKGFGGEFYRRGNAKQFRRRDVLDVDALAASFIHYHQRHDPLGVLRPHEAEFQSSWMQAWVHESANEVRLDLLPEKFYADYRLGHWNGPMSQAKAAVIIVNPLLLSAAARKNVELSWDARSDERFHFEVMRRAAPELVTVPFLNDTWSPKIAATSPVALPSEPFPTTAAPTFRALTQKRKAWPFLEHEPAAITQLFKDAARGTDMDAFCDMRKLRHVAKRAPALQRTRDVKELFSAIGVALALLDRTEPVLDRL
jgi:hypothetical protein